MIWTLTGEGRARTVARGLKMGRKLKLTPHQAKEALARSKSGEGMRDIAKSYDIDHLTIWRLTA